ncbi:MAG: hypothetical protein EU539_08855 [Promethearchaeota archaeon]|nr:MAG: hypothetical protein EU539_08855 [Candidatus Lokiarchaeota archaeon]
MVSSLVLLEGIATLGCYLLGVIVGFFALYKSTKTGTHILSYTGILILLLSHIYIGIIIDFFTLILINDNMTNIHGIYNILTYIWIGPIVIIGMYVILELVIPENTWNILPIYIALSAMYLIFLLIDPINQFTISYTEYDSGLVHSSISFGTPLFIVLSVIFVSAILLFGLGFLIMGIRTTGVIQRKFLILAFAFILFLALGALDILSSPGYFVIFLRVAEMSCSILFYLGIKEEEIDTDKLESKSDSEIDTSETSLLDTLSYYRPDEISEEDLTYHREQSLCMVCKKKLTGFNEVFVCPECKVLYCKKCALELINLDNSCWVCSEAIDKSKPTKSFEEKIEAENVIVDESVKVPKKEKKIKDLPKKAK